MSILKRSILKTIKYPEDECPEGKYPEDKYPEDEYPEDDEYPKDSEDILLLSSRFGPPVRGCFHLKFNFGQCLRPSVRDFAPSVSMWFPSRFSVWRSGQCLRPSARAFAQCYFAQDSMSEGQGSA
jgi:hypothetical protein